MPTEELYRTLNMGIGMVVIVRARRRRTRSRRDRRADVGHRRPRRGDPCRPSALIFRSRSTSPADGVARFAPWSRPSPPPVTRPERPASWCWSPGTARTCRRSSTPAPTAASTAEVVAVVSNRADVFALQRADAAGVPAVHIGAASGRGAGRVRRPARRRRRRVRTRPRRARRLDARPDDELPRLVPRPGDQPASRRSPASCPGTDSIERAWDEALAGERAPHRRDGPPRPRRRRRRRPGPRHRVRSTSTPAGTFEAFEATMHAAEHDLLVARARRRLSTTLRSSTHAIDRARHDGDTTRSETEIHA